MWSPPVTCCCPSRGQAAETFRNNYCSPLQCCMLKYQSPKGERTSDWQTLGHVPHYLSCQWIGRGNIYLPSLSLEICFKSSGCLETEQPKPNFTDHSRWCFLSTSCVLGVGLMALHILFNLILKTTLQVGNYYLCPPYRGGI